MKALVVLSGGQDSTTCLALAMHRYGRDNVHAVTFHYGQRHSIEIQAARKVAHIAGLAKSDLVVRDGQPQAIDDRHEILWLPDVLKGTSPLVNKDKAVEQYASVADLPGGLEKTFVPMRNTLFLTLAANRAVVLAMEAGDPEVVLITGVSQEDYGGYPDCRQLFIDRLLAAFRASLDDNELPHLRLETPLMDLDKEATVRMAVELYNAGLPVDDMLAWSHTCYNGAVPPCGKCHACHLRAKGFALAGVPDPLVLRVGGQ